MKKRAIYMIEEVGGSEEEYFDSANAVLVYTELPEAKWDLSGLFCFDDQFFSLFDRFRNFHKDNEVLGIVDRPINSVIESVHGLFPVIWNGGRNSGAVALSGGLKSLYSPSKLIEKYNSYGINVYYTASNPLIKKEHLDDESCNYLLDSLGSLNHEDNGVIVSSDVLSDYIREKYPKLKQKASIVKVSVEKPHRYDRDFDYYNELADRFDRVMVNPDDNLNYTLLEKMAKSGKTEKYEFLVNENCSLYCPVRDRHYLSYGNIALSGWRGMFHFYDKDEDEFYGLGHSGSGASAICGRVNYNNPDPIKRTNIRSCLLTNKEVKRIYDMGFRHFKLQGRGDTAEAFDEMRVFINKFIVMV